MLGAGCWALDAGCWVLGVGCWSWCWCWCFVWVLLGPGVLIWGLFWLIWGPFWVSVSDMDTNHSFDALPASNAHSLLRAQRFPAATQKANPHETRYQKATLFTCMFYVRWLRRNGLGENPLAIYSTWRGLQQLSDVLLASNAHSLLRAQRFLAALKKCFSAWKSGTKRHPKNAKHHGMVEYGRRRGAPLLAT